jgi:hypothetical protein
MELAGLKVIDVEESGKIRYFGKQVREESTGSMIAWLSHKNGYWSFFCSLKYISLNTFLQWYILLILKEEQLMAGESFQVDPNDLLSTYPLFYVAGDAIRGATNNLSRAVTEAVSPFDGKTYTILQTLSNDCITNLYELAGAMDEVASRLHQSALLIKDTDSRNARLFELNS